MHSTTHLLLLATLAAVHTTVHAGGISDFLKPADDPFASRDPYFSLPEAEKGKLSTDDGAPLSVKLGMLSTLEHTTHVEICLVGFDGDGNEDVALDAEEFYKYLDAHREHDSVHTLTKGSKVAQNRKFVFHVTHADPALAATIQTTIQASAQQQQQQQPLLLPISPIDRILSTYHKRDTTVHRFFLLNPRPPIATSAGGGKVENLSYAYFADKDVGSQSGVGGASDEMGDLGSLVDAPNGCRINGWVSQERYWWVDITASGISMGPSTSGDGFVTDFSTPHLHRFRRPSRHGLLAQELIAALSAFARKSVDALLNPPLNHFPVRYYQSVTVHLFVIHDGNSAVASEFFDMEMDHDKAHTMFAETFNYTRLQQELGQLRFADQHIFFHRTDVSFSDCELCSLAFTQSLKIHSSNMIQQNGLRTHVHQYLDARELHKWLAHYASEFWDILPGDQQSEHVRVVPIFLFSVSSARLLLLDRFHQAVSFDDMVVAVQTNAGQFMQDFRCGQTTMKSQSSDATRAVQGALLQTIWGVAPTHQVWNYGANRAVNDYQWSMSNTPFGAFSVGLDLSFAIKEAAWRNVLFTAANHTMAGVAHVLEHIQAFEKEVDEVFDQKTHLEFVRRWNLFRFKIDQGLEMHTLMQYNTSLFFFRSADHDVHAMWKMVNDASANIHSYLQCVEVHTKSWLQFSVELVSFGLLLYVIDSHIGASKLVARVLL